MVPLVCMYDYPSSYWKPGVLIPASSKFLKITARPEIHPLPLSPSSDTSPNLITSSRLLSLGESYPPTQSPYSQKPNVEISPSGQVSLVLDPRRNATPRKETLRAGRRDWLVCLNFETQVSQHGSSNQVRPSISEMG